MTELTFPTDPLAAVKEWRGAAHKAEGLRVELKAAQAHNYLFPPEVEAGTKLTDALRDAYATIWTRAAGRDAATAAVDAKAAERWAEFICEWTLRYESEWDGFNGND
jgi:hypothetical protein